MTLPQFLPSSNWQYASGRIMEANRLRAHIGLSLTLFRGDQAELYTLGFSRGFVYPAVSFHPGRLSGLQANGAKAAGKLTKPVGPPNSDRLISAR